VEIFKDRALGLPPLNSTLARRLMERTRIYEALKGVRGRKAINLDALEQLVVRFSHLVAEQPWIAEIDINPLLVSPEGFVALDARVVVHGLEVAAPIPPAIRPYPTEYVTQHTLRDGRTVTVRPIRAEDEPLLVEFHRSLSQRSVSHRYGRELALDDRIDHKRLARVCFNDYDREIALVVDRHIPDSQEHEILGVGRLIKLAGGNEAELFLVISDKWQSQQLGTRLVELLLEVGRAERYSRITSHFLPDHSAMRYLLEKACFAIRSIPGSEECEAVLELS